MKKVFIVCALGLSLAGCSSLQWLNPFAAYTNPVSNDTLVKVEASYGAAVSVAVAYHDACAKREIPPSCRPIVKQIQNADAYAHAQIVVARNFVQNNPTVDASALITTAQAAVAAFTTVANGSH